MVGWLVINSIKKELFPLRIEYKRNHFENNRWIYLVMMPNWRKMLVVICEQIKGGG